MANNGITHGCFNKYISSSKNFSHTESEIQRQMLHMGSMDFMVL